MTPSTDIVAHTAPGLAILQFWQWQDDGEVVAWTDGATITFPEELRRLQEVFSEANSPRFGAVLLVIAACREGQDAGAVHRQRLSELLGSLGGDQYQNLLDRVALGLDEIRCLPTIHREPLAAKQDLLQALFERPAPSRSANAALSLSTTDYQAFALEQIRGDLEQLDQAFERFDVRGFPLRCRTGLDTLPAAAEVEIPVGLAVRRLLDTLEDHEELGGLARIARQVMAATQLPRRLEDSDELPVGGVCDIAPRGSLDRLLLSELAQDDLVLSVRVALNEAMYLRRETPPRSPPRERWVLLDAGVRTWGVPRVFAAGVALALAAGGGNDITLSAFRSASGHAEPVNLRTEQGLLAHLASLDTSTHCGTALKHLLTTADRQSAAPEIVVVTEASAAADPEFQRIVEQLPIEQFYLATVDREGHFALARRTRRGQSPVSHATLDLEELLKPRKRQRPLYDRAHSGDLPAIYHTDPFPLRYCAPIDANNAWQVRDFGILSITSSHQLLHWQSDQQGAQRIDIRVPNHNLRWASPVCEGDFIRAIVGTEGGQKVWTLRIDVETRAGESIPLTHSLPLVRHVAAHGHVGFLIGDTSIAAVDLNDGRLLEAGRLEGAKHQVGRFFTSKFEMSGPFLDKNDTMHIAMAESAGIEADDRYRDWWAMSFDGQNVRFDRVYREKSGQPRLVAMFDAVDAEGPLGVTDSGNILFTNAGKVVQSKGPHLGFVKIRKISHDGRFVALAPTSHNQSHVEQIVETATGITEQGFGNQAPELRNRQFMWIADISRKHSPRHRFGGITKMHNGTLALLGRRGNLWPIDAAHHMELARQPLRHDGEEIIYFEEMQDEAAVEIGLRVAVWPNGSRAWLDVHGMLHLKSHVAEVPEITIVLSEGDTSGWCSDGHRWGQRFFVPEGDFTGSTTISQSTLHSFIAHLP